MKGIAEWLASLGLGEYSQRFAENAIDLSVLRHLTEQDLKDLGVLLGHRRKMLHAIAELDPAALAPAETATESVPRDEAERRHLTVMFCDLVGSTALSARLDPEDMRQVIAAYHTRIREIVGQYHGVVARYMGDGALVYFGYPHAHEDDAEQATRAGLALVDAMPNLQKNVDVALQVRIGIATGTVVVGDLLIGAGSEERGVVGDTPNLAARLQTLAAPGTVLICPQTRLVTGGHFDYRDLGPLALKGWAKPVPAWQVLGPSGVASRFEAMHKTKLPPLFGREEEIELLLRRWRHAVQEEGRVVMLTGEPGVGKSHISLALDDRFQSEPHITLRYFCSAHHTNSALFPFIGQIERAAGFERSDSATEKLSKLDALVAQSTADPEHTSVLANLLALPASDRYQLQELSPQKRKEKTLAALLAQLKGMAARRPVFMIFEDVHWIDPTSLELLAATVERVPHLRVLLLITARPEFTPPWPSYEQMTTIPLTRLGRRDGAALVERVTGGKTLPKEVMDEILVRTDGVPLFIEELTKTVLESGLLQERAEAGLIEKAIGYWLQAGKNAALRSANLEAIAHLQRGIEVTGHLPVGEGKDKSELDFQLVLGPCLIATQGPAASAAVATFARARELCQRLGEPPEYLQVMFWLVTVSVVRGELPQALEAVAALLSAAEARGDRPALINAIRGRAMILFFLGRIVDACEAIERAVEVFSTSQEADRIAARAAGQDAGVAMLALMSWVLWVLGDVDGAVTRMAAALERAEAVHHAHTHAYAWYYASVLHALRGEPAIAQTYAERCLAISEQHGFRQWLGLSRAIRDICAAALDASGGGRLDEVKSALDEYQRAGYQLGITAQFVLLCPALLFRNESEAALEVIDHGLSIVSHNSERCFEAELYRLKAGAMLMRDASDAEAESLLDQALRTARSQQARSLELRAATDLARLWMNQGKRAEALDVLSSIYGRFAEGFETGDLKEAAALLTELQGQLPRLAG
jgi:class 3 adenylate cyclase/tetratricopeptide (TPR) repeat protein